MPFDEILWPRKSMDEQYRCVFLGLQYRRAARRASRMILTFWWCSSMVFDHMTMSSRYTWQILPIFSRRATATLRWWMAGALRSPMGITNHSYSPNGVETAVSHIVRVHPCLEKTVGHVNH